MSFQRSILKKAPEIQPESTNHYAQQHIRRNAGIRTNLNSSALKTAKAPLWF